MFRLLNEYCANLPVRPLGYGNGGTITPTKRGSEALQSTGVSPPSPTTPHAPTPSRTVKGYQRPHW